MKLQKTFEKITVSVMGTNITETSDLPTREINKDEEQLIAKTFGVFYKRLCLEPMTVDDFEEFICNDHMKFKEIIFEEKYSIHKRDAVAVNANYSWLEHYLDKIGKKTYYASSFDTYLTQSFFKILPSHRKFLENALKAGEEIKRNKPN